MGVDFISCSLSAKKTAANTARRKRRFKNGLNHGGSQWSLDCCNKHPSKFRVLLRSFCGRDEPSIYTSPISNQNFFKMKYEVWSYKVNKSNLKWNSAVASIQPHPLAWAVAWCSLEEACLIPGSSPGQGGTLEQGQAGSSSQGPWFMMIAYSVVHSLLSHHDR